MSEIMSTYSMLAFYRSHETVPRYDSGFDRWLTPVYYTAYCHRQHGFYSFFFEKEKVEMDFSPEDLKLGDLLEMHFTYDADGYGVLYKVTRLQSGLVNALAEPVAYEDLVDDFWRFYRDSLVP